MMDASQFKLLDFLLTINNVNSTILIYPPDGFSTGLPNFSNHKRAEGLPAYLVETAVSPCLQCDLPVQAIVQIFRYGGMIFTENIDLQKRKKWYQSFKEDHKNIDKATGLC